jgi:hypothetical protein
MADFVAIPEAGITHAIGVSSRLRNQITTIDNYLHLPSQRQAGFTSAPYAPSIPAPASPPSFQLKQEPNPNIDPSLKNGMVATVGDDRFRMGVPQGLLEGFPLGFDIGQGTG